jgi:hypothetical protein
MSEDLIVMLIGMIYKITLQDPMQTSTFAQNMHPLVSSEIIMLIHVVVMVSEFSMEWLLVFILAWI